MDNRKILKASEGMLLTNGEIYGSEIYLGEDMDENSFYEIPESEVVNFDEADVSDYQETLERLGVNSND